MTSKNKLFKLIGSTFICSIFILLAFGSGDGTSELKDASKEDIVKTLCASELTDNVDDSGDTGLLVYKISLKMNENKTFKYSFQEEKDNGFYKNSLTATGTYELVGDVEETTGSTGTNKYGEVVTDKPSYTQKIKFNGTTSNGKSFVLNASVSHLRGQYDVLDNYWFFTYEDKAVSLGLETSLNNFRLPSSKIYP